MYGVSLFLYLFPSFTWPLFSLADSCFGSGSIDGTIILWTAHNLLPAKQFNTVSEYHGATRGFPYSVQSLFCVQEVVLTLSPSPHPLPSRLSPFTLM